MNPVGDLGDATVIRARRIGNLSRSRSSETGSCLVVNDILVFHTGIFLWTKILEQPIACLTGVAPRGVYTNNPRPCTHDFVYRDEDFLLGFEHGFTQVNRTYAVSRRRGMILSCPYLTETDYFA